MAAKVLEIRSAQLNPELRRGSTGVPRIGGYAARFNKLSRDLGGFVERLDTRFFNRAAGMGFPGVLCRYNHDDNRLLGTTAAGTLTLAVDGDGLDYDVEPPATRADVVELIGRGDVRSSSFAFRTHKGGDDWSLTDQSYPMRTLLSGDLVDVAPVNSPAYVDTSAALRSLALRMDASVEEIRAAADVRQLDRFFRVRSTAPMPVLRTNPEEGMGGQHALRLLELRARELDSYVPTGLWSDDERRNRWPA